MFKRGMDSQGQLSVEYLLLLVVIFVVFGFMITYLIGPSIDAGNDISDVSDASNSMNNLANAANIVYANGPGSKRTVMIYFPQDGMRLSRGANFFSTTVALSDGTNKTVNATTSYPIAAYVGGANSKGWHKAQVFWTGGKSYLELLIY